MRTNTPKTYVLVLLLLVATSIAALTGSAWILTGS